MEKGGAGGRPGRRIYQRRVVEIGARGGLDAKRGKKRQGVFRVGWARSTDDLILLDSSLRILASVPLPGS